MEIGDKYICVHGYPDNFPARALLVKNNVYEIFKIDWMGVWFAAEKGTNYDSICFAKDEIKKYLIPYDKILKIKEWLNQ